MLIVRCDVCQGEGQAQFGWCQDAEGYRMTLPKGWTASGALHHCSSACRGKRGNLLALFESMPTEQLEYAAASVGKTWGEMV